MDESTALLPNLFRTEYRKIVSVLCYRFGIEHIEVAEDIVSDTFLSATESWSVNGNPANPTAWLYMVAKNKTKNYLRRTSLLNQKLSPEIRSTTAITEELELDFSTKNITDSQLAMLFAVCDPCISSDSQIALALNLLCGFGIQEIADAFLTNKEVIYKRINRAKDKLKEHKVSIEQPSRTELNKRLETVLTTTYLLFSEGYYSVSQHTILRRELCVEAMRLCYLLTEHEITNQLSTNALLSLICFHSSRFDARMNGNGEIILYDDQDESLWNNELIERGQYYLQRSSSPTQLTRYHLEAGIAYYHTLKSDDDDKWNGILQLYNQLLILEYSPIAALNRTFALSKTAGKEKAIAEAEKLALTDNHFYFTLLGKLYTDLNDELALQHYKTAYALARTDADRAIISKNIKDFSA